jgi:folate/biopterin transporter
MVGKYSPCKKDELTIEEDSEFTPLLEKGVIWAKRHNSFPELQSFCICMLWFTLGISNAFPNVANQFYFMNYVKASPETQAMIGVFTGLGWNMKMVVAFTSDCQPIFGYRRKPYLILGLALYMLSYACLSVFSPSVAGVTITLSLATVGQMMCGVMCDTLIVENMRHETKDTQGQLQTRCWILITLGGIIGSLGGGYALRTDYITPQVAFGMNAALKLCILPLVWLLIERRQPAEVVERKVWESVSSRSESTWMALQLNSVWQPTIFVFLFGVLPNAGRVMSNYLIEELHFTSSDLSWISVIASLSSALGMHIYYRALKQFNWHYFFAAVIVISASLSLTQLVLVFGWNAAWGLPNFAFAMGDEFILDVTQALLQMPILILLATLCPEGVEGSVYALVTSAQMAGGTVGGAASGMLIGSYGITLTDYSNFWKLIILCAFLRLLVLPLLPLLPTKPKEKNSQEASEPEPQSKFGAITVVGMLVFGVTWALGSAFHSLWTASHSQALA